MLKDLEKYVVKDVSELTSWLGERVVAEEAPFQPLKSYLDKPSLEDTRNAAAGSSQALNCSLFPSSFLQPRIPLLLSRMKDAGKMFLATNSDYNYTDVSRAFQE